MQLELTEQERKFPATVPQVARKLKLSPVTIYQHVEAGKLIAYDVGTKGTRRLKIWWTDVEAYLTAAQIQPSSGKAKRRPRAATAKHVEQIV